MATFTEVLNLSISASWLVLAVVAVRFLLRRAPKAFHCTLWALVAIRLLFPFSIESELSLIPSREVIPEQYLSYTPVEQDRPAVFHPVTNPNFEAPVQVETDTTVGSLQTRDVLATLVWWTGMGVMAIFAAYSYLSLRLRVRMAARWKGRIWECDEIASPFILGVFLPRIYLPSDLDEITKAHVLAHENAHLKRRDHLWKPLGYLLLTIHWFNPIMWLGYWLLCRDIELACDEAVIRTLDRSGVCRYSEALVRCSIRRRNILACPLAFGEVGVKGRVKNMLNYRKPTFWMIVATIVIAATLTGCFLTDPVTPPESQQEENGIRTGAYLPQELEALDPVYINLQADGKAWFNFNLSSTNGACSYTLTESLLTLESTHGSSMWVFSVEDGGFRFQAGHSDSKKYLSNGQGLKDLPDGILFTYTEDEALHVFSDTESQLLQPVPDPVEEILQVPNNDPEELLQGYDIYNVENWSFNFPIDTDVLPETVDEVGETYLQGHHQVWGHQDSDLWITGVRRNGKNYEITLDFTHNVDTAGEIVLPYSPTDPGAPKLAGNKVTEVGDSDSFVITLTEEEYQSGLLWMKLGNLYHVKYVASYLNPQACPLIPGTEIYEAQQFNNGHDIPTLYLYPDGTALYTNHCSANGQYPCTYTKTEDSLILRTTIDKKEREWVFAIEDGLLLFRKDASDKLEYWGSSYLESMEDNDHFVLLNTIDSLDIAIWNTLYEKNHKISEIGIVSYRVLDVFETADGQLTAQVCYEYSTVEYRDGRVDTMTGYSVFCASITFDLSNGYQVTAYEEAYYQTDLRSFLSETAFDAFRTLQQLPGDLMHQFNNDCQQQARFWLPAEE